MNLYKIRRNVMQLDPRFEFSSKKVVTNILPPMMPNNPICNRKYTIYYSPVTCEYFLTVANDFFNDDINPLLKNEVHGLWDILGNGICRLKIYVNLGGGNNLLVMARYALYKRLLTNYIRTIIHGDRCFFRENKCLLNSLVTVRFISDCDTMNIVEPYGTLRNFR